MILAQIPPEIVTGMSGGSPIVAFLMVKWFLFERHSDNKESKQREEQLRILRSMEQKFIVQEAVDEKIKGIRDKEETLKEAEFLRAIGNVAKASARAAVDEAFENKSICKFKVA